MNSTQTLPPLSLYIHIPWCIKKCPYCDFNSHKAPETLNEGQYIDCLLEDLKNDLNLVQDRKLKSIFIGGGTPNLFKPESFSKLLVQIEALIDFDENIEISLEANPGALKEDYFLSLSQTGINRISLGVQSFQEDKLLHLGRVHSADNAKQSIEQISKHFSNFNIDLMFGLENQTIDDAIYDINQALNSSPKHLSWYQLTIEPNTIFYRNTPTLPSEDNIFDIQSAGKALLCNSNLHQYEISAFSVEGKNCRHNLNYWTFGDYIGIGAGAHGKNTELKSQTISVSRSQKTRTPKDYLNPKKSFLAKQEAISNTELSLEFFMNTLRLNQPIPTNLFEQRTGLSASRLSHFLSTAQEQGFITIENGAITRKEKGELFLDTLLGML